MKNQSIKGSDVHKGWAKGAIIERGRRYRIKLLDDGHYIDGGNYALWHFSAVRENGMEEVVVPETGDTVVEEPRDGG